MSDTGSQLCAEFDQVVKTEATDISAILVIGENKIITAERSQLTLYDENFTPIYIHQFEIVGWWGITDMALTSPNTFSILIPGFWLGSTLVPFEVSEDGQQLEEETLLVIGLRAFGLCYHKGYYFVTFSPKYLNPFKKSPPSYIQMISKSGEHRHTFRTDEDDKVLFGSSLSKIYVDENFKMFVCDKEKNEIVILKIDPFSYEATVIARHNYGVINVATKMDGTLFLATNHRDGVLLLHANGRWVFNNFLSSHRLSGTPVALAYNEEDQQLTVAVVQSRWFPTPKRWLLFQIYTVKYSHDTDTRVAIEN